MEILEDLPTTKPTKPPLERSYKGDLMDVIATGNLLAYKLTLSKAKARKLTLSKAKARKLTKQN